MNKYVTIQIYNEKEKIIHTIEESKAAINSFKELKKIISTKFDINNKIVDYYFIDEFGNKIGLDSENKLKYYKSINLYKVKIINNKLTNDLSLDVLDFNSIINKEVTNNVKDSLKCWICLNDAPIERPFFCPNSICLKGIHEKCLKQRGEKEKVVRCICGNFYNVEEWKSNKLVNELSEIALKISKEYNNKLKENESVPERCQKHPNNFLVHYCIDCKEVFCGTCFIADKTEKHKNHRLIDYKLFNELNKVILENKEKVKIINNFNNEYEINISSLEEIRKNYNNILASLYYKFEIAINELINKLNDKLNEIKKKNKNAINFDKNVKKFFDDLDRESYNELNNIDEIKKKFIIDEIYLDISKEKEYLNNIKEKKR